MDGFDSMFGTGEPEIVAQPEPKTKEPKPKRDKEADPRVGDKLWKFVQPWNWEVAKTEKKPLRIWTITDIVGLSRDGWRTVQRSAVWISSFASGFNLVLVVIFACAIASKSHFGLLDDAPAAWRWVVWLFLTITATGIAAVMQLCTDFGLAWSSGLAGEKYKLSPTVIIIVWTMCLATTLYMKFDLYSSWAHERQAVIVQAQTENANDTRILAKFPNAAPPSIAASETIINESPAIIKDLRDERARLIAARDQEKQYLGSTKTGMGPAWNRLNDQVLEKDREITAQTDRVAAAAIAKQDRIDYDAAKARQESNAKITANDGATMRLWYDHPFVIILRVVGAATIAIVGWLVYFASSKKLEDAREAAAAKAEAAERARKGWDTRRRRPVDAEWEEAAGIDARAIPDLGPVKRGAVAPAATHTRQESDPNTHPDATGDDYGAKTNGHGQEPEQGDVTDGTAEPDQPDEQQPAS